MDGCHSFSISEQRSDAMSLKEKVKDVIRGWLDITPAHRSTYYLTETFNFETNAIKNRIWMRGDPGELEEFYKQLERDNSYFWSASPRIPIRKVHTGLPSMMVQVLTDIVVRDFNGVDIGKRQSDWDAIAKDNNFEDIVKKSIKDALFIGDGAFKISFDKSISRYPIIEFIPGDKVDIVYERGRFRECIFKTEYQNGKKRYILYEHYGYGYVKYVLKEWGRDDPLLLNTIPQTANLFDVGFAGYKEPDENGIGGESGHFCMAIPFKIKDSTKWEYRGESIFDKKTSAFDAFDEVVSQWADAVRAARTKQYIPDALIPRDPETGQMLRFNQFDDRFLTVEGGMGEKDKRQIEVTQPAIPSENYLQSYISFLDLALQGIISPSTLGIDTKKLDNADAQREKEKTTLYTRGIIIDAIQKTFPILINSVIKAYDEDVKHNSGEDIDVVINFGEYASPSFEAVVETVAKARPGSILMSVEAAVEEMYGDSKDDDWKDEEVKRIKEEQGILEKSMPGINEFDELGGQAPTPQDYPQGDA